MKINKKRRYSIVIAFILCLGLFMPVNVYAFDNNIQYETTAKDLKKYKISKKDMKALYKVMKKLGVKKSLVTVTGHEGNVITTCYLYENYYTTTIKKGKVKLVTQDDYILYKNGEVYRKIPDQYIVDSDREFLVDTVQNAANEKVGSQCTFSDYTEWYYRRAEDIFTVKSQAESNGQVYNFDVRINWDRMHSHPITVNSVTLQ